MELTKIEGIENVDKYFSTLKTKKTVTGFSENSIEIPIDDYQHLGYLIESLLSVCSQAMDEELQNQRVNNLQYQNIFSLIMDLIPFNELELLTKIHQEIKLSKNG